MKDKLKMDNLVNENKNILTCKEAKFLKFWVFKDSLINNRSCTYVSQLFSHKDISRKTLFWISKNEKYLKKILENYFKICDNIPIITSKKRNKKKKNVCTVPVILNWMALMCRKVLSLWLCNSASLGCLISVSTLPLLGL